MTITGGHVNDFTRRHVGEWHVIWPVDERHSAYVCRCSCGTVRTLRTERLTDNRVHSCGCVRRGEGRGP